MLILLLQLTENRFLFEYYKSKFFNPYLLDKIQDNLKLRMKLQFFYKSMVLTKYGENCIIYTKTNLQKVRFIKLQCIYVCMYMYLCLYVNVCMYVCMYLCLYVNVCMYVFMYWCLYVNVCMYDVCIYVCMLMYVCMMYEFMSVC